MREVSFERPLKADPARVLLRVERWALGHGYVVAARSSSELSFVGAGTGGRHRLAVRADGQAVRFVFAPGAPGVTLPEGPELERRVDAALAELEHVPPPAAQVSARGGRCSICATALGPDDRVCPVCGMTV